MATKERTVGKWIFEVQKEQIALFGIYNNVILILFSTRSNLFYLPTGEMAYFVAAVAVLYNMEEHSQRHYMGNSLQQIMLSHKLQYLCIDLQW
jgi:hypothetical protein